MSRLINFRHKKTPNGQPYRGFINLLKGFTRNKYYQNFKEIQPFFVKNYNFSFAFFLLLASYLSIKYPIAIIAKIINDKDKLSDIKTMTNLNPNNLKDRENFILEINKIHNLFYEKYFLSERIPKQNIHDTYRPKNLKNLYYYRLAFHESINDFLMKSNISFYTG